MPDARLPEQMVIDVPTEHVPGAIPADPDEAEASKADFYRQLNERSSVPPACQPDHGVHVYSDFKGTGPCLCRSARQSKGIS